MVMQEMPKPRMTYVLDRGHYASPKKDEVIKPGVPSFLPPMDDSLPNNRLGLANWIVSKDNPLTPRVTVNRYWQMFFGKGLVETLEDFGTQGNSPTHPALLDWLATDFVENGWNVKRTLKQIVMSATYRQASVSSKKKLQNDPRNLTFSRGPRFRLMGEFLRDGALAAAGLLNEKVGGPSAKPYQPPGLWNEVSLNGGLRFKRDTGDNLYRKSHVHLLAAKRPDAEHGHLWNSLPRSMHCQTRRDKHAIASVWSPSMMSNSWKQRGFSHSGSFSKREIHSMSKSLWPTDCWLARSPLQKH